MKTNKTAARMSFVTAVSFFTLLTFLPNESARIPSGDISPDSANAKIDQWYEEKSSSLRDWLTHRGENGGPPDFLDFYLEQDDVNLDATDSEMRVALETKKLYDEVMPNTFIGTFFESGHPYIETKRGPYQWDSMAASGMKDPELFEEAISKLTKLGIKSFRLGPNIHEVSAEKPESWNPFVDKIETIWDHGATPIISVAFFPSLKKWQVKDENGKVDYQKSYLLHKDWPRDMGQLSYVMMEKIWERAKKFEARGKKVTVVINPVNEPETLAGFNRHFWHGAYANWSSPEKLRYYIPSVIQIAKTNVEIRRAVELASPGQRILFMHNEAMTPEYYPSHNGGGRFAVSKLMLGDDVLMKADLEGLMKVHPDSLERPLKKNELSWMLKEYIFGSWNKSEDQRLKAKKEILASLSELKALHHSLSEFGKTMKTDNMLHLDYYYQTEFIPNKKIPELAKELAANDGEFLAKILGVKSKAELHRFIREAAAGNEGDLPPEGPKGVTFKFDAEDDLEEVLSRDDYVLIERLIGLRRDYDFKNEEPYLSRQKELGIKDAKGQIYRLDVYLDKLLADDGKLLVEYTGRKYTREELDADGRKLFHDIIGAERELLIGFEPQHYARQIKAGIRYGFYSIFMDYVKTLRLYTVGVGESGTPFYIFAPLLHDQVMMEYARALRNGLYGTQYSFGPAVDTRGWAKAPLGLHYEDDHELNPSGLLTIKTDKSGSRTLKFRGDENTGSEWAKIFVNPLLEKMK
jgi:hypothetical protein